MQTKNNCVKSENNHYNMFVSASTSPHPLIISAEGTSCDDLIRNVVLSFNESCIQSTKLHPHHANFRLNFFNPIYAVVCWVVQSFTSKEYLKINISCQLLIIIQHLHYL